MIDLEIKDDIIVKLVENSGCTMEALSTIKTDIATIKEKLEEKANGCSVGEIEGRVTSIEDDLKPFRPVGKFFQKNTAFIFICFMVVICYYTVGIMKVI